MVERAQYGTLIWGLCHAGPLPKVIWRIQWIMPGLSLTFSTGSQMLQLFSPGALEECESQYEITSVGGQRDNSGVKVLALVCRRP